MRNRKTRMGEKDKTQLIRVKFMEFPSKIIRIYLEDYKGI